MACLNLQGYTKGCDQSNGGIKTVVLFEQDDVSAYTVDASGVLETLELSTAGEAYKYDFLRDNSNIADAIIGGGGIATVSYQPTINMIFRKASVEIINEVIELGKSYTVGMVEDNNGNFWTLGIDRGLELQASAGMVTGNTLEEANSVTLLLQGKETRPVLPTNVSGSSGIDPKILALFGY